MAAPLDPVGPAPAPPAAPLDPVAVAPPAPAAAAPPAPLGLEDRFALAWSSGLGAGYFPVASGTVGSLCALPLVFALASLPPWLWVLTVVAFVAVTVHTAHRAGRLHGVVDSKRIVADEFAGQLLALAFVPLGPKTVVAGFLLFRLFDIVKPWPASYFDRKVKNGFGVTMDDVVAGLYARAVLEVLLRAGWV